MRLGGFATEISSDGAVWRKASLVTAVGSVRS
jgi:hypothetical protein